MVFYCTREDAMSAPDIKASAYAARQIDSAIESGSRAVEGLLHRKFYPWTGTRYFDFPNDQNARTGRLWLDENELISVTSITVAGKLLVPNTYYLEPANQGPPFNRVELNQANSGSYTSGSTYQRNIAIEGVYGYDLSESPAGTVSEPLDAVEVQVDVSGSSQIGIGSILRIDSERMIVTDRSWLSSGQTAGTRTASANDVSIPVSDGSAFVAGETILVDSERMWIQDIAGNTLTVKRSVEGSALAAHTNPTIYVSRTLTVQRGALGTVAATHLTSAPVFVHLIPGTVRELSLAYTLNNLAQRQAGYARMIGAGDNARESGGRGIREIEDDAYTRYGRKVRIRAV